jgi:hypothetical protein
MLEGAPDAISASAYGLRCDHARESSISYLSTRTRGAGHASRGGVRLGSLQDVPTGAAHLGSILRAP